VTLLAVDGGNSKTDVALVATDGSLLAALRGPTASHQQVGLERGMAVLGELVAEARGLARLRDDRPSELGVYGLAGADNAADTRMLHRALEATRLADADVVVNDAFLPIRAGTDRGWGVALICGSGVNAAGIAPDGRTARLTALGDISGDWGGGYDLGMAALGAAVRARDGRGPRTTLEVSVPAAFGFRRPVDVTRAIEARRIPTARLRGLAPAVFASASDGDAVARSILDRQADELVAMGTAIIRRLRLGRLDPDIVLAGGIFAGSDAVFETRIRNGLAAIAPRSTVRRAEGLPVLGAALLALDRAIEPGSARHRAASARLRSMLGAWRPHDSDGGQGAPTIEK
jgi:N-acetylglucosamine kinase-like BadF-type ATPase